jgi:hypothetical protein
MNDVTKLTDVLQWTLKKDRDGVTFKSKENLQDASVKFSE